MGSLSADPDNWRVHELMPLYASPVEAEVIVGAVLEAIFGLFSTPIRVSTVETSMLSEIALYGYQMKDL